MPRKPTQTQPQRADLTPAQMEAALPKLARREKELREFDVNTIQHDDDPRLTRLANQYNDTLMDIFGPDTIEYNTYCTYGLYSSNESIQMVPDSGYGGRGPDLRAMRAAYLNGINLALTHIDTIKTLFTERLEDAHADGIVIQVSKAQPLGPPTARVVGKRIFVVHGHDEAAKETVARFISKLGLEPIILHEQANAGRTIIEKLEDHLDVDFAVVVLTPDDVGANANDPENLQPRARQNVVLELGLFAGVLGRKRVCALHKGDLELPSDFDGVLYVPMDGAGGWRLKLAMELKQADLEVDLNRAM